MKSILIAAGGFAVVLVAAIAVATEVLAPRCATPKPPTFGGVLLMSGCR